ncbi:MAG: transposase [Phycisphaeraceae bacterium]
MFKRIKKSSRSHSEFFQAQHRFEHWYVDNQIYFITARCRERFPAFTSEQAKAVFWKQLESCCRDAGFVPIVATLMDNHYHLLGYNRSGNALKRMMQRLHGSTAKLVNDLLPERRTEFWRDAKGREYFDGCIRDALQFRRAYRYTLRQAVRHGIAMDWKAYPHTRVWVELEPALKRALELDALMPSIPYKRYDGGRSAR